MDETSLTVREACRQRKPLDGADAQALEHALTQVELRLAASERAREAAEGRTRDAQSLLNDYRSFTPNGNTVRTRLRVADSQGNGFWNGHVDDLRDKLKRLESAESALRAAREMPEPAERLEIDVHHDRNGEIYAITRPVTNPADAEVVRVEDYDALRAHCAAMSRDGEIVDGLIAAMKSENTPCPWCSGRVNHNQYHDDYCPFPAFDRARATRAIMRLERNAP